MSIATHRKNKHAYSKEELQDMVSLYKEGASVKEIADAVGRTVDQVKHKLHLHGFSVKGRT